MALLAGRPYVDRIKAALGLRLIKELPLLFGVPCALYTKTLQKKRCRKKYQALTRRSRERPFTERQSKLPLLAVLKRWAELPGWHINFIDVLIVR
jgi:hypothetical protein